MSRVEKLWYSYRTEIVFSILLLAAVVPLVYGIRFPIYLWDESRLAVNAAEMAVNNNWLVTHFDGQPDLWNTKPPLLIWLQALCIKLFGTTEVAVRLPIIGAVLLTLSLMYWFSVRVLHNTPAGIFACIILISSTGYFRGHVARSGDYDALLIMWELAVLVFYFRYTEFNNNRDWWLCTAALIGAVLTKGVAGLLGVPGIIGYAICYGQIKQLVSDKKLYLSISLFILIIGGYYVAHELATPGYWQAVRENELGGRFNSALNNLGGTWAYYLSFIKTHYFNPWVAFILPAILLAWAQPNTLQRRATFLLALFSASWIIIISSAKTKLMWYEAPVYPALSLIVALGISWIWQLLYTTYARHYFSKDVALLVFVGLLFLMPYRNTMADMLISLQKKDVYYYYTDYLKNVAAPKYGPTNLAVLVPDAPIIKVKSTSRDPDEDYNPVFTFYKRAYKTELGLNLRIKNVRQLADLLPSDTVIVCDTTLQRQLKAQFSVQSVHATEPCQTMVILASRLVETARH